MKTINFKGAVVSPKYDCAFFADWIAKGVICPSSRMIADFESVQEGEDVKVFVDTPGGDVFAGDGIVISAINAKKRCGAFEVEVGSEACSMGANFVAAAKVAGAKVRCHSNSKVMFHSAAVDVTGGAELLKDRAALVEKINASVKANLESLGITETDEWFAEGREKWLGAEDLKTLGLVDEVIEEEIEKIDISEGVKAFRAAALKLDHDTEANRDSDALPASADSVATPTAEATVESPTPSPSAANTEPSSSSVVNDTKSGGDWEARFKGASRKINELTAERDALKAQFNSFVAQAEADMAEATKNFTDQLEAQKKDLAGAIAKVSELSAALEEKAQALSAKDVELGKSADALAKANEHVSRLESARQLLTAGVLTPSAEKSYQERLAAEPTAEGREKIRALKKAGKIK